MKLSRTMREALEALRAARGPVDQDDLAGRVTRPTLAALAARGLAESAWRFVPGRVWGVTRWALTEAGRAELAGK